MSLQTLKRTLRALAITGALSALAHADPQTDVVTPTSWKWNTNVSLETIQDRIADGNRLVDIEVESTGPLRFSAAFVANQGDHAKTWAWYYGQTYAQIQTRMNENGARLIDIEPYRTSSGIRYAIVLIRNQGSDFAWSHGYESNLSFSQLQDWFQSNSGSRILDIQPYFNGGNQRYAFAWVSNTGNTQSAWWWYANVSADAIADRLEENNARLIDLEPHDGTGCFSCLMVPRDGNAWFYFRNMEPGNIDFLANQYASRIIDIERYETAGGATRYAMVLRRNDNDLAVNTSIAMRSRLPFDASSGFLLREYQGTASTVAGVHENRVFEPASLMKMVHLFATARQVHLGVNSWGNLMVENQGLNGSCPTGSNPAVRSLRSLATDMMVTSSNTATEAIRSRYGTALIENAAHAFGAESVELNHTIGCFCGSTRNEVTLRDLADMNEFAIDGVLGNEFDDYLDIMSNGSEFGMGSFRTVTTINGELSASTLTPTEQSTFIGMMYFAHKGGSYTCSSNLNEGEFRSRGAYVRLPFRSGCEIELREYFIGAWVNDADTSANASDAVGDGITRLLRHVMRDALESWEDATCAPWVNYGDVTANSTGEVATCWATGSNFVLDDALTINSRRLPPNTFAFLLVGSREAFIANPGGSAGNLCVGGLLGRYRDDILSTGAMGRLNLAIDLGAIPGPFGAYEAESGTPLFFQWWYRDVDPAAGGATSNFSKALRVNFL